MSIFVLFVSAEVDGVLLDGVLLFLKSLNYSSLNFLVTSHVYLCKNSITDSLS